MCRVNRGSPTPAERFPPGRVPDFTTFLATPVRRLGHRLARRRDLIGLANRTHRLGRCAVIVARRHRIHGSSTCPGELWRSFSSARTMQPAATSICAIVAALWSPSRRGVQPAISCFARSAATTTNSYALMRTGRDTMTSYSRDEERGQAAVGRIRSAGSVESRTSIGFLQEGHGEEPATCGRLRTAGSTLPHQ